MFSVMVPMMGTNAAQVEKEDASLQPLVSVSVLSWCVFVSTRLCGAICLHNASTFPVTSSPVCLLPVCRAEFVSFYPQNRDQTLTLNSFLISILMIMFCTIYFLGSTQCRLRTLLLNCQIITFDSPDEYCFLRQPHGFLFFLVYLDIFLNMKYPSFHHVTSPCLLLLHVA